MRELTHGTNIHTTVAAVDEPSHGGACHGYVVQKTHLTDEEACLHSPLCTVNFQKGPIKEHGVNGITEEDLICILIDRYEGFQRGEYACPENLFCLTYLHGALGRLKDRTNRRTKAGIEGTSVKDPMCDEAQAKVDEAKAAHFEEKCMQKSAFIVFDGFKSACCGCEYLAGYRKKLECDYANGCIHCNDCDHQTTVDDAPHCPLVECEFKPKPEKGEDNADH